jgi:hypothetical protein
MATSTMILAPKYGIPRLHEEAQRNANDACSEALPAIKSERVRGWLLPRADLKFGEGTKEAIHPEKPLPTKPGIAGWQRQPCTPVILFGCFGTVLI